MNGFSANPEGLIQKGKSIVSIYENYNAERQNVGNTTDRIASAWEGADSTGYVSQIHGYDADFQQLGAVIERIGNILDQHGQRLVNSRDAIRDAASRL